MSVRDVSKAGPREWIGLGVLSIACILYTMDLTVLHLAVPQISAELQPTSSQLLWIIDIYGFFLAGSLITMGNLGDRIGRRKLLMIGAFTFAITSVIAAFSNSTEMLIIARALLGISGATLAPSTLSLIRNMFQDSRQLTFAISIWITSFSIGAAIGPLVGGVLLEFFWWGSVFLIAVPIMAMLLILGPKILPEFKNHNNEKIDIFSVVLSLASILSVIYGIKQIAQDGFEYQSLLFIIAGIGIGLIFWQRQKKIPNPMIDLYLFRLPTFSISLATFLLVVFVAFGVFLFISQYLQLVVGLSPLMAGIWMLPWAISFVVGSLLTPAIGRRIHPWQINVFGLIFVVIGIGLLTQVGVGTSHLFLFAGLIISSLGIAPIVTLATNLIIVSAPPERAGSASAISETTAEFGGVLGIAILGSIGAAIYRKELTDTISSKIPLEIKNISLDTLGGAIHEAESLSNDLSPMFLFAVKNAFVEGMHFSIIISTILASIATVLVFVFLRNAKGYRLDSNQK